MDSLLTSEEKDQLLRGLLKGMMETMMDGERTAHLGYAKGSSLPPGFRRDNHRNGCYERELLTGLGLISDLQVPRDRAGTFMPSLIDRFERRTERINDLILALYRKGMTERDIRDVLTDIYDKTVSAQTISTVAQAITEERQAWERRPLKKRYTALFIDCLWVKLRREVVDTDAVYVIFGIDDEGHRDALSLTVGATESATVWQERLQDLQDRGVREVLLIVADGLTGLPEAVAAVFPQAQFQRCIVHQVRNTLAKVRRAHRQAVADDLKTIYQQETKEAAEQALDAVAAKWRRQYPRLMASWQTHRATLLTFLTFPLFLRRYIYTTNWLERLNKELRKVTKTKNSFPTEASVLNLIYAKLRDTVESWEQRRLMGFESHTVELAELWLERYPHSQAVTQST